MKLGAMPVFILFHDVQEIATLVSFTLFKGPLLSNVHSCLILVIPFGFLDADCETGLTCYYRSGFDAVPGCSGSGEEDFDYCI